MPPTPSPSPGAPGRPPPERRTDDPSAVPSSAVGREFAFEKRHFDFIVGLIHQLAGIALAPHKLEMVYARLARRLRELRIKDFDAYCALLESERGAEEVGFLVNALTTNLTAFFRESHHFDHLAEEVLPELRARHADVPRPRLRLWSAGCSSGQEPYTLAMVLASSIPDLRRWDARILATDIDTHMVETARRGLYPAEAATGIPPALRERFTRRVRENGDTRTAMDDQLKRLITVKPLNLLEPWPMKGPFDAIFCRNVLIYFDRPGRTQVIEKFSRLLSHGGFLYLGHSESLYGVSSSFRQVGPTIYRRV
ncbi:protein-glutamate O-methyltransferase [Azospirillum sp. RWY-5-1]|uniref:Chemotaxis protein methyltransferase n=1 Tax=Azospirillum oleiclasticum TaxID=2735135 RepID=A0ABX2TDF3_9PROT|nr:protein-glutamate O-methyltransferase [Azospirillum oleiclasticum]NYZ14783.1 protein-glutamate O-methyltransferase [Azospirillum oleiclasticum]NYZ22231.1 protein-glutamate O-methyltransferase [Azospirillum oleiclasticum]